MIGAAAGFILRKLGGVGRSDGRSLAAALIAACTSRAAPSMLRLRSNWIVIDANPIELTDVISVTPEISPSRRSSGAATVAAIVVGSAPRRAAPPRTGGEGTPAPLP